MMIISKHKNIWRMTPHNPAEQCCLARPGETEPHQLYRLHLQLLHPALLRRGLGSISNSFKFLSFCLLYHRTRHDWRNQSVTLSYAWDEVYWPLSILSQNSGKIDWVPNISLSNVMRWCQQWNELTSLLSSTSKLFKTFVCRCKNFGSLCLYYILYACMYTV